MVNRLSGKTLVRADIVIKAKLDLEDLTNIEVYLKNPAGIGEHSDILEAIQGEMDKMAVHEDRLDILNNYLGDV